jgi:ABC-2 type transport system permease protein
MFITIFIHELRYWFRQPAFYIYLGIFLLLSMFFAASAAGIFDFLTVTTGSSKIVNSPIGINGLLNGLTTFIFFLFPSIIGVSIYRDYKSEMHTILYSYPFSKSDYLLAKFFSSLVAVTLIVLVIALAMIVGFRLPGTNQEIVGQFNVLAYLHSYFVYLIPNILLFGAIVFAVVTFSRNIAAGFITVVLLMLVQGIVENLLSDPDYRFISALVDPFGSAAANYYTKYWTVAEQNELLLPIKGVILYNRLIWLAVASLVFGFVYRYFSFSQDAISFSFRKAKGERTTKHNFGGITRVLLPKVNFNYSFLQNLKTTWRLSNIDFKYIVKSWPFLSIVLVGLIFILLTAMVLGQLFGTKTLPVTWQILLVPGNSFALFINITTFLYAGMLVHRGRIDRVDSLVNVTPIPNWALLVSKLFALLKMQLVLLLVILAGGIAIQVYNGYYNFEIGHYLYELYVLNFIHFVIWALLALFVQVLIGNPYLGLFIMLVISMGIPFLSGIGIEQSIFKYNQAPGFSYSDMNGYGTSRTNYLVHKFYWLLAGLSFLVMALLFWVRGFPSSFRERLSIARSRLKGPALLALGGLLVSFLSLGFWIYYENNIIRVRTSANEREKQTVEWEKKYKKYEKAIQPRIVDVKAAVNIFPKELNFDAEGTYLMINKSKQAIDSIFLDYNDYPATFVFDKKNELASRDTLYNFNIYVLNETLHPGDSLSLSFTVRNKPNRFLRNNSPVRGNGTFINNAQIFPSLGYNSGGELTDDEVREKYDLPKNELKPPPTDTTALSNTYIARDADWIDFEATVSTSEDQIAIAPGYLQKEWVEDGRRFFHYKMDSKILNFYAFNSGVYQVKKDKWQDVNLEIYYNEGHEYNLDRMLAGIKASLAYNSDNFSPYQHKQVRIIEFPRTGGGFAQSFPNTIPFSEGVGFIADVDDSEEGGVDYPFAVTVHEVSHQWWAHQVIGADVLGATMLSESLSEYVSLKVLEHQHGKSKMRKFLKVALDNYLSQRTTERKREKPLMYNDGQGYIRYQKGSLVFYALSDYIGEDSLNSALKKYIEIVKFQEPPYTTSIQMVDFIREVTPDSLSYVIKDMFETITLYKNRIVDVSSTELDNGKYQVDIEFNVSKYRNNEKGKRYFSDNKEDSISYKTEKMRKPEYSIPLADYIEIGVFSEETDEDGEKSEVELYLKKHKITTINNKITLIVDQKPTEVGVDPYNKLIDTKSDDNRRKL